jgi:HPt (histidine-containing phosphotransfer) domain-containing protein
MQSLPGEEPDAPAVNHAGGIARLMGDGALFARVLGRFSNEYRQTAAGIRGALDTGDNALALRLVHTLKGAAAMIEALPLRQEAQALEQILRGGAGDPGQRLLRLEQALDRVLHELDAAASTLPERPPTVRPAAAAHGDAHEGTPEEAPEQAHERLIVLLDEGNGDAVDLVREREAALTAQLGEQGYHAVAERIEAFDFDGALALLKDDGTPPR